jgi:hypothetical protein
MADLVLISPIFPALRVPFARNHKSSSKEEGIHIHDRENSQTIGTRSSTIALVVAGLRRTHIFSAERIYSNQPQDGKIMSVVATGAETESADCSRPLPMPADHIHLRTV